MEFTADQIMGFVQSVLWPFLRITGMFLVAPMYGAALIPARIKVILALTIAMLIAPLLAPVAAVEPLSARMLFLAANQILIGVAIGFVIQIVFEALTFAGQTISMTMGLGYATLIDPLRGASVPVVSQFFIIMGLLLFISFNGHLALIQMLVDSFQWLPAGESMLSANGARNIFIWGGKIFSAGLMIGLPAIVALIVVNLALGVVSRAAPSLNLFAVGFPVTLGIGFIVLLLSLQNLQGNFSDLFQEALQAVGAVLSAPATLSP